MAIKDKFPAIRPSLLLDFTRGMVDPRISFTRASTATRVNAQGLLEVAPAGTPRVDYDPVTRACKGLLIEEQRTNLLTYSNGTYVNAGIGGWSNNGSLTAIVTAPDGTATAEQFSFSTGVTQNIFKAVSCSASTTYTLSLYYKLGTLPDSDFKIAVRDDTAGVFFAFDVIPTKTTVNNGWIRASYAFTTPAGCVVVRPYLIRNVMTTGGTVAFWGSQLEAGSFPTSYIPTTTAAVTRAADVVTMTGVNFSSWYRQDEGTIVVEPNIIGQRTSDCTFIRVDDGTANNRLSLGTGGLFTVINSFVVNSGASQGNNTVSVPPTPVLKAAFAFATNSSVSSANSVVGTTDSSVTIPVGLANRILLGRDDTAGYLNGHLRRIAFYPARIPNDQLQALTT